MSVPGESIQGEPKLVRYLLGLLPEEEAERLDEQSIVVDEFAARLQCVENDLVDAYVSGTLDGDILERFESFYLASPLRREKVKFAERLLAAADRASAAAAANVAPPAARSAAPVPQRSGRAETDARVAPRWRMASSLAAAAMLLVACGFLLLQDVRLRRGLSEAQREGAALGSRAQELARQLEDQRAANSATMTEIDRIRAAQPAVPITAITPTAPVALVLLPQARDVGPVPAIALESGSGIVAFDLTLEAVDFPRYEVALKDPATSRTVWRSGVLTPRSTRPATIAVAVPASVLKPQHYSFDLSGRSAGGAVDIVGSYAFQIRPR
jgi:hypothetical protein